MVCAECDKFHLQEDYLCANCRQYTNLMREGGYVNVYCQNCLQYGNIYVPPSEAPMVRLTHVCGQPWEVALQPQARVP